MNQNIHNLHLSSAMNSLGDSQPNPTLLWHAAALKESRPHARGSDNLVSWDAQSSLGLLRPVPAILLGQIHGKAGWVEKMCDIQQKWCQIHHLPLLEHAPLPCTVPPPPFPFPLTPLRCHQTWPGVVWRLYRWGAAAAAILWQWPQTAWQQHKCHAVSGPFMPVGC